MLDIFFKKQSNHDETQVLNTGVGLAIKHYMKPLHEYLIAEFPALTDGELRHYDRISHKVVQYGLKQVDRLYSKRGTSMKKDDIKPSMTRKYPWITDANISSIVSMGIYHHEK